MGSIKVQVSEETEKRFRETAMRHFGFEKGSLSLAAERAFLDWSLRMKKVEKFITDVKDPASEIRGILSHVKKTSVELQHEASKIRAEKAIESANRREHLSRN